MNTWDSARRAQLHKSVLAVVLSGIFIFLAAVEISALVPPLGRLTEQLLEEVSHSPGEQ